MAGHQTPTTLSAARCAGSGSTVSVHLLPFQCSAIGSDLPDRNKAAPTAQQFAPAEQDTPRRNVFAAPATLGLAFSVHVLPFQCSINVRDAPEVSCAPTAQQDVTRGHVTPMRARPLGPADGAAAEAAAGITASSTAGTTKVRITDQYATTSETGHTS